MLLCVAKYATIAVATCCALCAIHAYVDGTEECIIQRNMMHFNATAAHILTSKSGVPACQATPCDAVAKTAAATRALEEDIDDIHTRIVHNNEAQRECKAAVDANTQTIEELNAIKYSLSTRIKRFKSQGYHKQSAELTYASIFYKRTD